MLEQNQTRKQLEIKKLDLMVKIQELQLEMQKINSELYRHGVDFQTANGW